MEASQIVADVGLCDWFQKWFALLLHAPLHHKNMSADSNGNRDAAQTRDAFFWQTQITCSMM